MLTLRELPGKIAERLRDVSSMWTAVKTSIVEASDSMVPVIERSLRSNMAVMQDVCDLVQEHYHKLPALQAHVHSHYVSLQPSLRIFHVSQPLPLP